MGLASALSTALTGLTAAETTIDVVGNNLANSNTVGFKSSEANFATQFLQTRSLGSAPSANSGGTNPRQIGLGTKVAAITPNFNQGTIEISSNPTDLAIQGDGFFIVRGGSGEQLYTRNGIFKLNAQNELVTITGHRLLGFGVNEQFELQNTLDPITIPLGSEKVAAPTENVYLQGTLSPTGELADTAEIIQSAILSDGQWSVPADTTTALIATPPDVTSSGGAIAAGGALTVGTAYTYRIAFANTAYGSVPNQEGVLSADIPGGAITPTAGNQTINLTAIPDPAAEGYSFFRVYRSSDGGATYNYIDEVAAGTTTFQDDGSVAAGAAFNTNALDDFGYSYYVTYYNAAEESRPAAMIQQIDAGSAGRIKLSAIPTEGAGSQWTGRRIYRNLANDDSSFHRVVTINDMTTTTFTDTIPDATLVAVPDMVDLDGPKTKTTTLLTDVWGRDGTTYSQMFKEGTLSFTGRKGGRKLATQEMTITATSTVLELMNFMEQALGIQSSPGPDPVNPVPGDAGSGSTPGASLVGGQLRFIGNNGTENALDIGLSGLQLTTATGIEAVSIPFGSVQSAIGESAVADFVAYDALGNELSVRLTTVLESRTSSSTTYRWFAESADNSPLTGVGIGVGTGLLTFDGEGNFISSTEATVAIDRMQVAAASPLEFELDFSQISGLATKNSNLQVARQDGSGAGVLTSFIVGEDGSVAGVFSNGVVRDLGQIQLARFANPNGLEQRGENMYSTGVNSGLPLTGDPGAQGIGTVISGAVELSNTDIGANLIDLILASTMYRGNTRVITTAQQMLDELLMLRR